ncbi:hypothetical protein ACFL2T_01025 [Elusimicrobiota bacterium]
MVRIHVATTSGGGFVDQLRTALGGGYIVSVVTKYEEMRRCDKRISLLGSNWLHINAHRNAARRRTTLKDETRKYIQDIESTGAVVAILHEGGSMAPLTRNMPGFSHNNHGLEEIGRLSRIFGPRRATSLGYCRCKRLGIDRESRLVVVDGEPRAIAKGEWKILEKLLSGRGGPVKLRPPRPLKPAPMKKHAAKIHTQIKRLRKRLSPYTDHIQDVRATDLMLTYIFDCP